jgi:threonine/homoserine/homoserine lactone efflux protein
MLLEAVGALLPIGLATALSPFPVVAVILILAGTRPRSSGPAFVAGWVVGIAALTMLVVAIAPGGSGDPARWVSVLRMVGGLALIGLALRKWRTRPRPGDEPVMPSWMASVDSAGPGRALQLGLLVSAANPKIIAFSLAAGSIVGQYVDDGGTALAAVAVYVALASLPIAGAVVVGLAGGRRAMGPLLALRDFMIANNNVIVMVIFLLIGAKLIGDGLGGL